MPDQKCTNIGSGMFVTAGAYVKYCTTGLAGGLCLAGPKGTTNRTQCSSQMRTADSRGVAPHESIQQPKPMMKLRPRSTRVKAPAKTNPLPKASTPSTTNDVTSSNPSGRGAADCQKVKGLLTCKANKLVGTLNTRALSE